MKSTYYVLPLALVAMALTGLAPRQSQAQENWTDSVALKGDLRLRHESIDEDGEVDRQRGRFRTRLGLTAKVNDNVEAVIQLASGGDNPVSTNQSFDDGFSTKDIGLDLAYVDWAPSDSTHVYGGKMKNPLFRPGGHALIWDSDLNPEGLAIAYETGVFFGTLAGFVVEERASSDDSLLVALQGGVSIGIFDGGKLTAGFGYFDYSETQANQPFFDGRARGNSVDVAGDLLLDYNEFELFAQFDTKVGELPLSVFVDFVQNSDADTNDSGYAFGVQAGKAKLPGSWQVAWAWQDLEADAVIATFTDSDFGGGGTDAKGHLLKGKYALADNWALAGTLFLNDVDDNAGNKHDYTRLQIDLEFKF